MADLPFGAWYLLLGQKGTWRLEDPSWDPRGAKARAKLGRPPEQLLLAGWAGGGRWKWTKLGVMGGPAKSHPVDLRRQGGAQGKAFRSRGGEVVSNSDS